MMFDLLAASTLTLAAASVIATYGLAFGTSFREQAMIAAGLTAWFAVVLWLGATGVLLEARLLGIPGLAFAVAIPITVLSTLLLVSRQGHRRVMAASLPGLIGIQSIRVLGYWFVLLHAAERLPAPFAPVAGWGDILAGVLAIPAAWMALRNPAGSRSAVMSWNVIGTADLIAAVTLGLMSLPGPLRVFMEGPSSGPMNALPWIIIPGFLVPTLLTLHIVVFYRLRAPASARGISTSEAPAR